MKQISLFAVVGAVFCGITGVAKAVPIVDTAGDFLPTYAGAINGAFDVISADATFDGVTFHLTANLAGPVSGASEAAGGRNAEARYELFDRLNLAARSARAV